MNKVLELRNSLKLSQKEFADFLGFPYTTIRTWEEKNRVPKANVLHRFTDKISNFNIAYFLDENETNWFNPPTHSRNDIQTSPRASRGEIKVFGRVAAGAPIATWGDGDYTMIITGHPRVDKVNGKVQGFIVDGDSFDREYASGDLVYATYINYPAQKPKDGDWVITFFDTEPETVKVTVKEFQWLDHDKSLFLLKPRSKDERHKDTMHSFKGVRTMLKVQYGLKFAS